MIAILLLAAIVSLAMTISVRKRAYRRSFEIGDICAYKEDAKNPFGTKHCFVIVDKRVSTDDVVYYKTRACSADGVFESDSEYVEKEFDMEAYVVVGRCARSDSE